MNHAEIINILVYENAGRFFGVWTIQGFAKTLLEAITASKDKEHFYSNMSKWAAGEQDVRELTMKSVIEEYEQYLKK